MKTTSQQLIETRQRLWENRAQILALNKQIIDGIANSFATFIPSGLPDGLDLTLSILPEFGQTELNYAVVDAETHEVFHGAFILAFTPICETGEIELMSFVEADDSSELLVRACLEEVAELLGVRRVIFTALSESVDGNFKLPNRAVDHWMDYVETRDNKALDMTEYPVDIYAWEVTL